MSLADEDTMALKKKRQMLDSSLMNMIVAGVEVPAEMAEEFAEVQDELLRRGQSAPLPVRPSWTTWLGQKIGAYKIQHLIEEGLYWYLFQAAVEDAAQAETIGPAMIKVAKGAQYYGSDSGRKKFPTLLFAIDGDIVRQVEPAQNVFMAAEIQRLTAITHGAIPVIDEEGLARDHQYYRTPHFSGDSLDNLLTECYGQDNAFGIVSMFSQIASALDELGATESFNYHGNLKPENIIFTAAGVYFRELGDFGPLLCGEIMEAEVRTTTPQYYPWLDVDDIGALGICLWDGLLNYHPFDDRRAAEGECIISDGLKALVDLELSLANTFVLPLLSIKRPHQIGFRTSEKLEHVLFKSIKLKIGEDGMIYEDPGYESMAEFNHDLLDLLNETQMIF